MSRQLLIIEGNADPNQGKICDYLAREGELDCKQERWDLLQPLPLSCLGADLVLFTAPAHMADPSRFFAWLQDHPLQTASMSILPADADTNLLRMVARTVDDFVLAPVNWEELRCRVARILGMSVQEEFCIRQQLKREMGLAELVGDDPEFVKAVASIPRIAASNAPVLLMGETGTGKELCAQAIHSLSSCQSGPFIPVDCGAIPENLVENELFGHARGAFTDAHTDQKGVVAMAEKGTLFLDEIDSLPPPAQAKLLRFVQEGTYRPLGAQKLEKTNLRLIAATNRDLRRCIREGKFRADLYFRLSVLPLELPPLRQRRRDVVLLANHFLIVACVSAKQARKTFSPAALRLLQNYSWPGNVRELQNTVQRVVALSSGPVIFPAQLGQPFWAENSASEADFRRAKSMVVETFEKTYVEELLLKHDGNVTRAAREAGKDRRVFGRMMKKYNILRRAS